MSQPQAIYDTDDREAEWAVDAMMELVRMKEVVIGAAELLTDLVDRINADDRVLESVNQMPVAVAAIVAAVHSLRGLRQRDQERGRNAPGGSQ